MAIWGSSRNLLTRFEVGQDSESLYAHLEVGQDSAELLGKAEARQSGSAELLGKANVTHSVDLLGKGNVRQPNSAELLSETEIQQPSSSELLGKADIIHSTRLWCNAIIRNISSATLYARAEVGQDSGDLFASFEAQDTQALYTKGIVRQADLSQLYARTEVGQGAGELFAKAVVGQGSVELFGRGIVRGAASSDLKGIVDIMHSIELLGRAVIGHPAPPVWLKAIFSIGLTNAYRDLGSVLELRRAALVELLGKAIVRHPYSEELLGKAEIKNVGSAELLGNGIIRNVGSAELLCGFAVQGFADLRAKMIIGSTRDSDTYFSFWDPSDWINEVVGVGQGFINLPYVEADAVVKTCGNSSARLTSVSGLGQYKEIRFGWGGMNWGVEAAVPPEIAPTPIDTDGRGPRRGSRASRDWRREVPQSSYKELKAQLYVEMAIILPGGLWDYQYVWKNLDAELETGTLQGQIEIDPATGAITARTRHAIDNRTIVTMCGGYRAYSKGVFTFDAEASAFGGVNPVYSPAFGLVGNKYDFFAGGSVHAAMLYYYGAGEWHFYTEDDGDTESTIITGIDFSAQHTYIIDWEDATEFPATGRVRLWIDGDLKATHTVAVPTNPLLFFLLMNSYIVTYSEDDVWTKLHSFSVTGDT